jgi:hypothetical protein
VDLHRVAMAGKLTPANVEIRQPLQRRILRPMLVVSSKYIYNLMVAANHLNRVRKLFGWLHANQDKATKSVANNPYLLMISFETEVDTQQD